MSDQKAGGVSQEHEISRSGLVVIAVSAIAAALLGALAHYQLINSAPISQVLSIVELAKVIAMSGGALFIVIEVLNPVGRK